MNNTTREQGSNILGAVLVMVGALLISGQYLNFDGWNLAWPFFVIGPGLLFFVGMVLGGRGAGVLAVPGSVVTTVGLVLLYQNTFDHWESWAYAWSLVALVAVGVGLMVNGLWSQRPERFRRGRSLASVGMVVFTVGAVFFESVIGISGRGSETFGAYVGPGLLLAAGVYLLSRNRPRTRAF